jgi:prepilin-type N-terminal cleavage/methylation domain-containing protein
MLSFFKKILSPRGFSLVEVLTAIAIAGGTALALTKINFQAINLGKQAEVSSEINFLINDISYIMSNKDNCNATLGLNSPVNSSVSEIRRVVRGEVSAIYQTGNNYGANTFTLGSMTTEPSPAGLDLIIKLVRVNKTNAQKGIIRRIPIKAVIENGVVKSCNSDNQFMLEQIARQACRGNSARWDETTKECHHDLENLECGPGQVLERIEVDIGVTRPRCADIVRSPIACPEGHYLNQITPGAVATCTPLSLNSSCGPNQYLKRIQNGGHICENIPVCSPSQILKGNLSGELSCVNLSCSNNQYVAGINSAGGVVCKNFTFRACPAGQYIKEVSPSGNPVCDKVPNHQNLVQENYSFLDGFDSGSNNWSRKTKDQIAQQICATFSQRSWDGTRCSLLVSHVPVAGGWTNWSSWGACSGGIQTRSRTCTNPIPTAGGAFCEGNDSESQACGSIETPINGGWSSWSSWGTCSGGTQNRTRTCTNPAPANGGADCVGSNTEAQSCGSLPVNGGWSAWSSWSGCPKDGGAPETRTRTCTNPAPANGGANCSGQATESRSCNVCSDVRQRWEASGYTSTLFCCPSNMFTIYSGGDCESRIEELDGGEQLWRCPTNPSGWGNVESLCN